MSSLNLETRWRNNVFFRSVLTLALGGSVGQIISFLLQPVITRIYTPEDMGVFSSLIAIISLWSVISVGRYDCAIILPDDKKTAQAIVYLCFIIALFVSILSGLWYLLRSFWGKPVSIETYRGYLFIPVLILLNACDLIFMRIAIRGKKIGALSLTQVLRQLGDKSTKIILGFFYNNPISLMIGTVVGEVIRISVLAHHTFRSFFIFDSEKISKNNIITVAKRYKKFPLLNTWSAFLDTASSQLPIILFTSLYSKATAGYYGLCLSILVVPVTIIGTSIANVFMEKIARIKDDIQSVQQMTLKLFKKLLFIGTFGMSIIVMYGDILFPILFGQKWKEAGIYSQWRAPSLALVLSFSPLSSLFDIYERLERSLILGIFSFIVSIFCIVVPYFLGLSDMYAIACLSIGSLIIDAVLAIYVLSVVAIPYTKTLGIILIISIPIYIGQFLVAFFIRQLLITGEV